MSRNLFLTGLFLSLLVGCGGDSGNSPEFEREREDVPEPETIQKIYRSDLKSINPSLEDSVKGQVIVRLEDESFEVNVGAQDVPAVLHPQHIRTGKSCPGPEADTNRDGVIDLPEAEAVSGRVYLPLDNDLNQVRGDNGQFPHGGFVQAYVYREDTTRQQLVTELGAESRISFENRVVMILGVDGDDELPPTVRSPDGRDPHETLPLACGELFKVLGPE